MEIGPLVNIDHELKIFYYFGYRGSKEGLVAKRQFNPEVFLAKVGGPGKTVSQYGKGQIVFAQGEEADRVFYIQSGKIKLTVVSEQGKEAVVAILEANEAFSAKDV